MKIEWDEYIARNSDFSAEKISTKRPVTHAMHGDEWPES